MQNQFFLITLLSFTLSVRAQQATDSLNRPDADKYIASVNGKVSKLEKQVNEAAEKALNQFKKQEEKILRKLQRVDSLKAKAYALELRSKYERLAAGLREPGKLSTYIPGLDSMSTSLQFLGSGTAVNGKLNQALDAVGSLKSQIQKAEEIRAFIKARKQELKEQLEKLGFAKELKKINKQVYYYAEQLKSYKEILNDPRKIEQKALELLSKTKLWKDFFRKNSMLAGLFRLPNPDEPLNMASLAGLQTRAQVNTLIQQQIASGGPNAQQQFQQNMQAAQSQLNDLKSRILRAGGGSSDAEMPEGFKPNHQKTKSFLQRLEYGANVQTQRATNYFPVTSDLGLSLGYKLNDKSVIGIGASYKLGLGRGWNNISVSHQGVGIRSYMDWKIKGSFWISGGYEQNYRSAFTDFDQLRYRNAWQKSGLIGISKVVSIKSKLFKKTRLMLLWDFLSGEQVPRGQPVVVRVGYNF